MNVTLTQDEVYTLIEAILCDGLYHMGGYGFDLEYDEREYEQSRLSARFPADGVLTLEDVQLQMLKDGYGLTFVDVEGEGEFTRTLTMDLINKNLEKVPSSIIQIILDEEYDAGDADACLQYLLFEDIIFG